MSYSDFNPNDQRSELEIYQPWYANCLQEVWKLHDENFLRGFLHGGDMMLLGTKQERLLVEEELRFLKLFISLS